MDDWCVWLGQGNVRRMRSAFEVNLSRGRAEFSDGTSQMLLVAEVKNYQPYIRDCGS